MKIYARNETESDVPCDAKHHQCMLVHDCFFSMVAACLCMTVLLAYLLLAGAWVNICLQKCFEGIH